MNETGQGVSICFLCRIYLEECINCSPQSVSLGSMFNVLSTKPVLNKVGQCMWLIIDMVSNLLCLWFLQLTTYTVLLQVEGYMKTYTRECPDPCWPF